MRDAHSRLLGLFIRCTGRTGNFIVLILPDRLLLCTLTAQCLAYLYAAGERDLGSANCLARTETAIAALKCVCTRVRIAPLHHSRHAGRLVRIYARGKLKSVYGFYLLMASWCCVSSVNKCWRFIKLMFFASQQAGAHLSCSASFALALFGAAVSCLDSSSGVTQGPCCA